MLARMIGDGFVYQMSAGPLRLRRRGESRCGDDRGCAFWDHSIRDEYAAAGVTTLWPPSPYRLTHGKRNPIAEWLGGLGLFGLRSYEKFFPPEIFATPADQVTMCLRFPNPISNSQMK